jgi:hypothetical protein
MCPRLHVKAGRLYALAYGLKKRQDALSLTQNTTVLSLLAKEAIT